MLIVGRPRTKDKDLPIGVRMTGGRYYVRPVNESMRRVFARAFPGRTTAPLGDDKTAMRSKWVKLFCAAEGSPAAGTVAELIDRFLTNELPLVNEETGLPLYAEKTTQPMYRNAAERLRKQWGHWRYARTLDEAVKGSGKFLLPMHIDQYLRSAAKRDGETKRRPHGANKDVVVLKTIFNFAPAWGLAYFNPCAGIRKNQSVSRTQVPTDEQFMLAYEKATPVFQCIMDLAQMTGQRRGAISNIMLSDIRDDGLRIVPNKTRRGSIPTPQLYPWTDEHGNDNGLRAVVDRALELRKPGPYARKRVVESMHLFVNKLGRAFGRGGLDDQWSRAIEQTGIPRKDFHFHDIRGKTGSESADDEDARKRLGHTDIKTTRRVYRRKPVRVNPLPSVSATATSSGTNLAKNTKVEKFGKK